MSLGLDALNKLQRMREEGAATDASVLPPPAYRAKPQSNQWLVAALIFCLGVGTAVFFLRRDRAPAAAVAAAAPAAAPAASSAPALVPAPAAAAAPAVGITFTVPGGGKAAEYKATSSLAPNPLIASFVEKGVIGGVDEGRNGGKAMVLFDDSIYHLNDMVNVALGVRLIGIQSNRITFQDGRGVRYVRELPSM